MVKQLAFNQLSGVRLPVGAPIFTGGWCTGSIRLSKSLGVGSIPTPPANLSASVSRGAFQKNSYGVGNGYAMDKCPPRHGIANDSLFLLQGEQHPSWTVGGQLNGLVASADAANGPVISVLECVSGFWTLFMNMATEQWRLEHKADLLRYSREWYKRNSERVIRGKIKRRQETQEWLWELKETLKCECGQNHIACLVFHHMDPKKKDIQISNAAHNGWSKKRILKEIEKCKVLCANCHAILHWNKK